MIFRLLWSILISFSLFAQTRVELDTQTKGSLPPDRGGTGVSSCLEDEGLIWQSGEFVCSALASGPHASTHQHGGSDEVATATPSNNAIPKAGSDGRLADGWLPSTITRDLSWTGANSFKNINGVRASKEFEWSQTPGGSLVAGTNSVTLTPCPSGVDGANTNHYVFINDSDNLLDEAVLITGGTCTSSSPSGTIEFTTVNAHSSWSIASATAGIQEAVNSLPGQGGAVYIPAGTHTLKQTVTLGNGTASSASDLRGIHFFGEGMGPNAAEITTSGVTLLRWDGPSGGTMLRVAGPIAGNYIHDFMLDGNGGNVAGTGLEAVHVHASRFQNISVTRINSVGVDITSYADGPFAIGAGVTTWEGINVGGVAEGIVGFRIGPNDYGSTSHLSVARNIFTRCEVLCNASDTTGIGFLLRFADSLTFIDPSSNFCTESIRFDPPDTGSPASGRNSFPNGIVFFHAMPSKTPTSDAAWTGNKNVWFLPMLQEEDGFGAPQPPFPDIKGVGGFGSNGGWILDNTADQVGLKIRGHSLQNENLFEIENSSGTELFTVDNAGMIKPGSLAHAALPSSADGSIVYCSDCASGTAPCASGGSGALAVRVNGSWQCQ